MHIFEHRAALADFIRQARQQGQRIGLVPTMGNLHPGHLSLVKAALADCQQVVATLFVNPMQFGPGEDFERYPRSFDADCELLDTTGCHALFAPSVATMYPAGLQQHTRIQVPALSEQHCGASRPGHFDGVATVVCKLFNLVQPDLAYFGLKDYQQVQVIRRMTQDLCLPIEIIGLPTVREDSGLAMSSRNGYLSPSQRQQASALYATLQGSAQQIQAGQRDYPALQQQAMASLAAAGLRPDYYNICQAETLAAASPADRRLVILAAVYLGDTRLIDNLQITLEP